MTIAGCDARDTLPPKDRLPKPVGGTGRRSRLRELRHGLAVLVAGTLLSATAVPGQRPKTRIFSIDEGLPSAAIYDLEQDTSGRLWILGQTEITVYDGRSFRTFNTADGLPGKRLGGLAIGEDRLWTVTRSEPQLFFLSGSEWLPLPRLPQDPEAKVLAHHLLALEDSRDPQVVVGTSRGLFLWDGRSWSRLTVADGLPSESISALASFGPDVFVGTSEGPCVLSAGRLDCSLRERDERLRASILGLHAEPTSGDRSPRLWMFGRTWLGYLENGSWRLMAEDFDTGGVESSLGGRMAIVDRSPGAARDVYFGTPSVLFRFERGTRSLELLGTGQGLASAGTTALLQDRESHLWVASLRGLTQITSRRFMSYDRRNGLFRNEVSAIAQVAPGSLILGHEGGLTFMTRDRVEILRLDDTSASGPLPPSREPNATHRVLDIAVDRAGDAWLAAHHLGLVRLSADRTWRVELGGQTCFSVELDAAGTLWTVTRHAIYSRQHGRFRKVDLGVPRAQLGFYRWLHQGPDGTLYLATRRGLVVDVAGSWRLATGPSQAANNVYNVLAEPDGTVWIATGGGLYRLDGDRLVPARTGALDVRRPVYLLLRDARQRLWIGTDDGMLVWDGGTLRQLSVPHGLAGREVNRGAGLVDEAGRVWIGTASGLSVYREELDQRRRVPPLLELREIEVEGRSWPKGRALDLAHDENHLVFHVEAISLSREQPLLIRYRLEGLEDRWQGPVPLETPRIRYPSLPSGSYRLRAAAGWPAGEWSDEVESQLIRIAHPPWRQPWLYALALTLAAGIILGAHGLRVQAMRSRTRELEALNARLEGEATERRRAEAERLQLIEDLQAKNAELERFTYTVSHDLKTPLVTIQGFAGLLEHDATSGDSTKIRHDLARIQTAATKMGRLLDELLELSRLGRITYERESVDLNELVRESVERVDEMIVRRGVTVEITGDLPAVVGERVRLLEVVQNLVENALKFLGDQADPRIEIGTRGESPHQVIYVRDNGIGIDPAYHERIFGLFERLDPEIDGTGVGLAIVRRVVELHGGRIWVESEGPGHGSTFCFTLSTGDGKEKSPA